ncbi:MAG: S41 family peptidase [Candidatus Omnitrophica bacterium]|nr:S41 family peptidase [Candidatus Omnitrophota bacterium]
MRRRWWLIGLLAAALASGRGSPLHAKAPAAAVEQTPAAKRDEIYRGLELFDNAMAIVRSDYVEQPEERKLIYGALKGMLSTLDPYSQFLDPDSYNELKVETGGEFGGLGIEITIKDELLTIISPIDDTPAFHAKLQSGDRIIKIDGELTRGVTLVEAVKKLRGKPGTKVTLTILREGESELKEVALERAIIKIQSVREATILEERIGYVRLSDFSENSARDLEQALAKLRRESMEGLVLDLRNNPGGLLDVSVAVTGLFLDDRDLVVSIKGRLTNQNQEYRAKEAGPARDLPLIVLINEGSASASEIVAGAIQDHHRGVVIGTKSHGKGSVQTIFPLKDGSALRLTTSKYFTPSGRTIHGQGIAPDVDVPFERPPEEEAAAAPKGEDAEELFDRLESEKESPRPTPQEAKDDKKDSKKNSKKDDKKRDNQLARAVDLLKGIRVYQSRGKAVN